MQVEVVSMASQQKKSNLTSTLCRRQYVIISSLCGMKSWNRRELNTHELSKHHF